ncbi:MAG: metal-dependent transcriptional regulator [Spirochaetaceae bacterium]
MAAVDQLAGLSETMQMYLKTVHDIQARKGAARVTDIADTLGVRKASVTSALRNLSSRGLVNYTPYDVVTLTDAGASIAEQLDRRYSVLHDFLVGVLGIDPDTADTDACSLEHHLSETLYERLIGFIDYYQSCAEVKFRWEDSIGGFCPDRETEPGSSPAAGPAAPRSTNNGDASRHDRDDSDHSK